MLLRCLRALHGDVDLHLGLRHLIGSHRDAVVLRLLCLRRCKDIVIALLFQGIRQLTGHKSAVLHFYNGNRTSKLGALHLRRNDEFLLRQSDQIHAILLYQLCIIGVSGGVKVARTRCHNNIRQSYRLRLPFIKPFFHSPCAHRLVAQLCRHIIQTPGRVPGSAFALRLQHDPSQGLCSGNQEPHRLQLIHLKFLAAVGQINSDILFLQDRIDDLAALCRSPPCRIQIHSYRSGCTAVEVFRCSRCLKGECHRVHRIQSVRSARCAPHGHRIPLRHIHAFAEVVVPFLRGSSGGIRPVSRHTGRVDHGACVSDAGKLDACHLTGKHLGKLQVDHLSRPDRHYILIRQIDIRCLIFSPYGIVCQLIFQRDRQILSVREQISLLCTVRKLEGHVLLIPVSDILCIARRESGHRVIRIVVPQIHIIVCHDNAVPHLLYDRIVQITHSDPVGHRIELHLVQIHHA